MFGEFFKKEVFTALKRPMLYIFMGIVMLLVFGAVVSDNVVIGGAVGDVKKNAPTTVAMYITIMNIFGLMFATAFFNNAALRDHKYKFNEILFTTPLSKAGYFFGRFCGAWLLSCLVMVGIYLGFIFGGIIGPAMSWIGPERIGPIPWKSFINTFFIFVIPNMLFAGAVIFGLATKFKNTVISFVGTLVIIIGYLVSLNLMSDLDNQNMAALLDMFGVSTYNLDTQYFTPFEKNTIAPSFSGHVLKNRILWFALGLVILFLNYFTFSFASKSKRVKKKKEEQAVVTSFAKPNVSLNNSAWADFASFFKINFISISKNTVFVILILFSIILLITNLWGGFEYFGLQSYPVTYKMLDEINGISTLFVIIILVFFSGELVWRDRDNHINEVIDGTAHNSIISLVAKTLSLALIGSIVHFILILIGIVYQTFNGYTNYELGLYFTDFFTGGLVRYIIWGGILVFIQVMANHKYIGYFISVLFMFFLDLIFLGLKIETKMLMVGTTPGTMYSDMNSFGPGFGGHLWFSLYWVLFGISLLLLAGLFWPRGMNKKISERFAVSKKALGTGYYSVFGFFSIAWMVVAGFVYYNTQVLNTYDTSKTSELEQVAYEKNYKKYENVSKPSIIDIVYNIDIFPKKRGVNMNADLLLTNKNDHPIDSLLFTMNTEMNQKLIIDQSELIFTDEGGDFLIYKLNKPIQPGDTMAMKVEGSYEAKGFENSVSNMSILKNGTFFNSGSVLPIFGYASQYEISDKNKRKKFELPEKTRMPELQTECSKLCMANYLTGGSADWVNVETFISTSEDQIAIAPGSKVSEQVEAGRRKYHYKLDQPSQNFYSFISADYEVESRKWNGIDLEVYYHKDHGTNVEMMLNAIQKSLEYFTTNFGPYYHKQARIIEFPRYQTFAQAFPGTMPYSEAFGFIINLEEKEGEHKNNVIEAVIAHEMAHQYWAHQVIGANMQGSTMLSESFAEYSSLMVMKQETSPNDMKDFLKYDMRRYLRGRSRETEKELPLHKVENQGHIHYGKGSVILYALQDYIGEDKVNNALKGFLEEYKYKEPPYPTSNDFMRYLSPEVPDSLQYLIKDWFEEITLYDLRLLEAKYEKIGDQYQVDLDLIAKKNKATGDGQQKEEAIADWVDIGFYKDKDEKELMYKERIYLENEKTTLSFKLDDMPAKAAIDPLRLLIERVVDDNIKVVTEK